MEVSEGRSLSIPRDCEGTGGTRDGPHNWGVLRKNIVMYWKIFSWILKMFFPRNCLQVDHLKERSRSEFVKWKALFHLHDPRIGCLQQSKPNSKNKFKIY